MGGRVKLVLEFKTRIRDFIANSLSRKRVDSGGRMFIVANRKLIKKQKREFHFVVGYVLLSPGMSCCESESTKC